MLARSLLVLVLLAGGLALAGTASAAEINTSARCYVSGQPIALSGQGFTPSAPVTVRRGRRSVSVTADAGGAFTTEIAAPRLNRRRAQVERVTVRATDGTERARRRLRVTTFTATTKPVARRPSDVVTWRVAGFPAGRRVFAHYVHRGRQVERRSFGRMPRRCGVLRHRIRQLPVTNPAAGRWRIQLDLRKRYRPGTRLKIVRTGRVTQRVL